MHELKFEKIMHVTFDLGMKEDRKMTACGAFIINAPWQLDEKLNSILPKILQVLKNGDIMLAYVLTLILEDHYE
jgi:23S rRNA A2030 N6-methylase RlmJ